MEPGDLSFCYIYAASQTRIEAEEMFVWGKEGVGSGAHGSRHLWDLRKRAFNPSLNFRFQQVYTRLTKSRVTALLIPLGYQIEMLPEHTITLEATYLFIRRRRTWEKCSSPLQVKTCRY